MLILLPPSETKYSPAVGTPVDLSALSHPELTHARQRVGDALIRVSGQRNALAALGVGAGLIAEVHVNRSLWANPSGPAAQVYSGVLYEAAGMRGWDAAALERAHQRVRIVSALWGAVSPADSIPAYRLSMSTSLGRIGPLAAYWRKHLHVSLEQAQGGGIAVDCRSSSYAAPWRPADPTRWIQVRVERDVNGARSVVSHHAKHTRGLLTGHLVRADAVPDSADDLADAARSLMGDGIKDVELTRSAGTSPSLTLVV